MPSLLFKRLEWPKKMKKVLNSKTLKNYEWKHQNAVQVFPRGLVHWKLTSRMQDVLLGMKLRKSDRNPNPAFFQFSRTVSYHLELLTLPPETQRPSSPPPASPASGPGSPGILHWRKPPQPALTTPPTPLNTPPRPLTTLHLFLRSLKVQAETQKSHRQRRLAWKQRFGELRHKGGRAPGRCHCWAASPNLVC